MKRETDGLTSWLFDQNTFTHWQREGYETANAHTRKALFALLREIWIDELDAHERVVLQGLHLHGKSEAAIGRELGLHHSSIGRMRRRAEAKLRVGLGYAMRYGELMQREQANQLHN